MKTNTPSASKAQESSLCSNLPRIISTVAIAIVILGLIQNARGEDCHSRSKLTNASGVPIQVISEGYGGGEAFLRYSPDGSELARFPRSGPMILSETNNYNKLRTFEIGMSMLDYAPCGSILATAEGCNGLRLWDTAERGELIRTNGAEIRLLQAPLKILIAPSKVPGRQVLWTEFSPDGGRLLATQANGRVTIWNTQSWLRESEIHLTDQEVRVATFSPNGKRIVYGDAQGQIYHWDLERNVRIADAFSSVSSGAVSGIAYGSDGKTIAISREGSKDSPANTEIWDTDSWESKPFIGYSSASYSLDGKTIALGGPNIKLIEPISGDAIREIVLPSLTPLERGHRYRNVSTPSESSHPRIRSLDFSPDGRTIAVGSAGPLQLVETYLP